MFIHDDHRRAAPVVAVAQTTAAPTTTTIDPGVLPQSDVRPSSTSAAFDARMRLLWHAIVTGQPASALGAFFPLRAYEQVKAVTDPASDWQHRLVAQYTADILRVHASLGAGAATARLLAVSVPDQATWVAPGAEVNRIGYWRVYNTTLTYDAGGVAGTVVVISMISWRGEWYVVHFRTRPS
jgi:hypothetical protein